MPRNIIGAAFVSMDGVMQAPGGPEEDKQGGFEHGGWFAAYRSHLLLDPAHGIGIVVLANSDSASPDAIADDLYLAVTQ